MNYNKAIFFVEDEENSEIWANADVHVYIPNQNMVDPDEEKETERALAHSEEEKTSLQMGFVC